MLSRRALRRRLQTVRDMAKVARALKAVSVSKMRRCEKALQAAASYDAAFEDTVRTLGGLVGPEGATGLLETERTPDDHHLFAVVVVASDRGLCGSYNQRVLDRAVGFLSRVETAVVFTVGKKADLRLGRLGIEHTVVETDGHALPNWETSHELAAHLYELVATGTVSAVAVAQNTFESALSYRTEVRRLLPFFVGSSQAPDVIVEPDVPHILPLVLSRAVAARVHHWLAEAYAAEHTARMVAMGDAYENCEDLEKHLTLQLNKLRQSSITKELLEIVSGTDALR